MAHFQIRDHVTGVLLQAHKQGCADTHITANCVYFTSTLPNKYSSTLKVEVYRNVTIEGANRNLWESSLHRSLLL